MGRTQLNVDGWQPIRSFPKTGTIFKAAMTSDGTPFAYLYWDGERLVNAEDPDKEVPPVRYWCRVNYKVQTSGGIVDLGDFGHLNGRVR